MANVWRAICWMTACSRVAQWQSERSFTVGSVVRIHPWEPFFVVPFAISTNCGARMDIWLRQIPAPHTVSSLYPKGAFDPFRDSQYMPRFKTGQQAEPFNQSPIRSTWSSWTPNGCCSAPEGRSIALTICERNLRGRRLNPLDWRMR
jgi:hypothetical protein